jgi:hypothetical protein
MACDLVHRFDFEGRSFKFVAGVSVAGFGRWREFSSFSIEEIMENTNSKYGCYLKDYIDSNKNTLYSTTRETTTCN